MVKVYRFHGNIKVNDPSLYEKLGKPHILRNNSVHVFRQLKSLKNKEKTPNSESVDVQGQHLEAAREILFLRNIFNVLFAITLLLFVLVFLTR